MFASILLLIIPLFINIGICGYCVCELFPSFPPVFLIVTAIVIIFTAVGFIGFFKSGKRIFILLPWLATVLLLYIFRKNIAECVVRMITPIGNFSEIDSITSLN